MFPFILPLIRAVRHYINQDDSTCGGINPPAGNPSETPPTPAQDTGVFRRAADFLRGLGGHVGRSFGPLRSPIAERVIRETVIPSIHEGSMFLPDQMPFFEGASATEIATDVAFTTLLGVVPGGAVAYALRRGVAAYVAGGNAETPTAKSPAAFAAGQRKAGHYMTFRRHQVVNTQAEVLECR